MCKKINRFFPCLIAVFVLGSIAISYFTAYTGITPEYWQQCILSELLLLVPSLIFVAVNRINILACLPYRRLRWQDALLSLLIGYMLIPVVLFINVITSLFATNYLQESSVEFTSYPYPVQVVIIAMIPAFVEEFVFRGLIYHSYRKNGLVGAILFSALSFGIMHMNLNQFFYAFIIGMFFAKMVEVTGSMWSSVLAHFAFNTYSITMVQILKMMGIDAYDLGLGQAANSAASVSYSFESLSDFMVSLSTSDTMKAVAQSQAMSVVSSIIQVVVIGLFAALFLYLANRLINHMAKMNNRYDYFKYYTSMGLTEMNNERFVTLPYAVTVILACIYMIVIEVFQHL